MPNWLRFPLTLLVIGAVAGGGLALVEDKTKPRIEENKKRKLVKAFQDVPGFKSFRELPGVEKGYELQGDSGATIALAAEVPCPGSYNSRDPIAVVAVFDRDIQKVLLVRTSSNKETPGLGTKLSAERPPPPLVGPGREEPRKYPFLDQFTNRSVDKLAYERGSKDFDAVTGATVSSAAILNGVKMAAGMLRGAKGSGQVGRKSEGPAE